jgi:hypothetical protein
LFINRYRFVELKYRRTEQNKKEGDSSSMIKPARIETVVIFLPDVHSCMPNRSEWDDVKQQYKQALEKILTADNDPVPEEDEEIVDNVDGVAAVQKTDTVLMTTSEISTKTDENSATDDKENGLKETTADTSDGKDLSIVNLASHKPHRLTKIISCLWFFSFVVWIIFSSIKYHIFNIFSFPHIKEIIRKNGEKNKIQIKQTNIYLININFFYCLDIARTKMMKKNPNLSEMSEIVNVSKME